MSVAGVASAQRRGALPTGQSGDILTLDTSVSYDLSAMAPGDMVAFQDGINFIGVVHRTDEQIEAAQENASLSAANDAEIVVDQRFLVVNLRCEHRGCQVGYTGEADAMFQCPCHRTTLMQPVACCQSGQKQTEILRQSHTVSMVRRCHLFDCDQGRVSRADGSRVRR